MRNSIINTIVAMSAVWLSAASTSGAIVSGPIVNPANGHEYYLLAPGSWATAEAAAVALGGHLATINDAAENNWVLSTFLDRGDAWIGYRRVGAEWVWVSG